MPVTMRTPLSHTEANCTEPSQRAASRWSMVLLATLVTTGCSTISTVGQLSTSNNQRVMISQVRPDQVLTPGEAHVQFGDDAFLFSRKLMIDNQGNFFEINVPASSYHGNGFHVNGMEAQLFCDIDAHWEEVPQREVIRQETDQCSGVGYCEKMVQVLVCRDMQFDNDSREYERRRGSRDCEEHMVERVGLFPDCPGRMSVDNTYLQYQLTLKLMFMDQSREVARYTGTSGGLERKISSRQLSPCHVGPF